MELLTQFCFKVGKNVLRGANYLGQIDIGAFQTLSSLLCILVVGTGYFRKLKHKFETGLMVFTWVIE